MKLVAFDNKAAVYYFVENHVVLYLGFFLMERKDFSNRISHAIKGKISKWYVMDSVNIYMG